MRGAGGQCDSNEEPEGSGMSGAWYCDRWSSRSVDSCGDCDLTRSLTGLS